MSVLIVTYKPRWNELRGKRRAGAAPEEVADMVLRALSVSAPAIDVEGLATSMGISIMSAVGTTWSGAVNSTDRAAAIWVRVSDAPVRRRFTIAHELGHILLHDLGVAFRDDTFTGDSRETQANQFAAQLLMPSWMLAGAELQAPVPALARRYNVSDQAMKFRIANLTGRPHWSL
jgi:Zn-dependent peptidase ImmA (M78 family)